MSNEFDYDLNIFQREQMDAHGEYAYFGPWYIHIYQVNSYQGATVH